MSRNCHIDTADNSVCARQASSSADRRRWAILGLSAIDAGTPDRSQNDDADDGDLTAAIDTITNVLHGLDHLGCADPLQIFPAAQHHFTAERKGGDR